MSENKDGGAADATGRNARDEDDAHEVWPDAGRLEAAVLAAAERLQAARRRGRKRDRIRLIDTLRGLFDELARGERLYMVNRVARSFSEVAIDQVPPRPEQVLACWELAYRGDDDPDALGELVEAKTSGLQMKEKAKAWQAAREAAEESAKKVGEASSDDPDRLIALSADAKLMAEKQAEALRALVDLISPKEDKPFVLACDYVGDLALATGEPRPERDNRRRGLKPDGAKIRDERTLKEWSRNRLLEEIKAVTGEKLSTRTIARAEEGQSSDRKTLDAIARALKLTLDEIVVD